MKVGSGHATGIRAETRLVEEAVAMAMARAGLSRAQQVLLLLSKDFKRQMPAALRVAAARTTCLQIDGFSAEGVLSERGWHIDKPAAVAMVFASDDCNPSTRLVDASQPLLSFSGQGRLPWPWQEDQPRVGLISQDAQAWQLAREQGDACCCPTLPACRCTALLATGLQRLSDTLVVTAAQGHELQRLSDGRSALDSLIHALPAALREQPPMHQISLQRSSQAPAISILSINANGSLTLSSALQANECFYWALRQPMAAEMEMRQLLIEQQQAGRCPDFALLFSCIGRGPLFFGAEDKDLQLLCESFPETPVVGAYGSGQIFHADQRNQLFHNAALTLLYERQHVQPDT